MFALYWTAVPLILCGSYVLAVTALWIISNNGGNTEWWAPWVAGSFLCGAMMRYVVALFSSRPKSELR
jgi:hypothetical protein